MVMSLLPSSSLHSLEDAKIFLEKYDFLDVAEEQDYMDLASAALVCREWRCLADDPLLWRDFVLQVDSSSNLAVLPGIKKFSAVRSLVVITDGSDEQQKQLSPLLGQQVNARVQGDFKLETLVLHHPLMSLERQRNHYGFLVCPSLLKAVPQLKNLLFCQWGSLGTAAQVDSLFAEVAAAMDEGRCDLQYLSLANGWNVLGPRSIAPVMLAKVVSGLVKADIDYINLGKEHVAALMAALLDSNKLTELDISGSDLSQVEPKTLAKIVHNIKTVSLDDPQKLQLDEILKMCTGATKLQTLIIGINTIYEGSLKNVDMALIDGARKMVEIKLELEPSELRRLDEELSEADMEEEELSETDQEDEELDEAAMGDE